MPPTINPPNAMPSNAFETVVLGGLVVHTATGEMRELTLHRSTPVPNDPIILDSPGVIGPNPPERLPSQLPPPGNLKVKIQAVKVTGDGRVGNICQTSVRYQGSSPELRTMLLPPLVLKISRPWKADSLAREAFYYEEMECLQGSVVPRYYGVYEATIPDDCEFVLWRPDLKKQESKRQQKIKKTGCPFPPIPRPTLVRVLLLERVGDRLPLGKSLPPGLSSELKAMYADLARLGVDQDDIRYYNILRAPASGTSPLPLLSSPFTQRTYKWRIVDFDRACKSNVEREVAACKNDGYLDRLLINLPYGDIWEPWE